MDVSYCFMALDDDYGRYTNVSVLLKGVCEGSHREPCLAFDFYDLSKYMLINFFIPSVIVDASKNSVNDFVSHSI